MKTAFYTVVYPYIEKDIPDFIKKIEGQTDIDFDLVLVNDGIADINQYINTKLSVKVLNVSSNLSIAKVREESLNKVIKEYDQIIFGDADDYFENDRIEIVKKHLAENPIVVNELRIVDQDNNEIERNYFSNRLEHGFMFEKEFIVEKNIVGFSNLAIKTDAINDFIEFHDELKSVDWYFAHVLLNKYYEYGVFVNDTFTYYVQHENNIIGIGTVTEEKIELGINVKAVMYEYMLNDNLGDPIKIRLLKDYYFGLKANDKERSDYLEYVIGNCNNSYYFWWEEIIRI